MPNNLQPRMSTVALNKLLESLKMGQLITEERVKEIIVENTGDYVKSAKLATRTDAETDHTFLYVPYETMNGKTTTKDPVDIGILSHVTDPQIAVEEKETGGNAITLTYYDNGEPKYSTADLPSGGGGGTMTGAVQWKGKGTVTFTNQATDTIHNINIPLTNPIAKGTPNLYAVVYIEGLTRNEANAVTVSQRNLTYNSGAINVSINLQGNGREQFSGSVVAQAFEVL